MGSNDGESRAPAARPGGEFHVEVTNSGQSMLRGGMYEARLLFPPRRTRFKDVRLRKPHGDTQPDVAREDEQNLKYSSRGSVLLWVAWDKSLAQGEGLSLTVSYEGERPMDPEIDPDVPHLRSLESEAREKDLDSLHSKLLDDFKETRRKCIDQVRKNEHDKPRADQMDFFLDYDIATNPEFLRRDKQDDLANVIEKSIGILADRVTKRYPPGQTLPELSLAATQKLSEIQLTIFKGRFRNSAGGIAFPEFRDAFIAFSCGKLEPGPGPKCESRWNGKPNSANFFLFAEFAIQAVELGVNAEDWEAILPVFVECQDIYAKVFKPFCNYPNPDVITPVPCDKRNFGMYRDAGRTRASYDLDTVMAENRDRYGNDGIPNPSIATLLNFHTENARRFFPLGKSGPTSPCEALTGVSP